MKFQKLYLFTSVFVICIHIIYPNCYGRNCTSPNRKIQQNQLTLRQIRQNFENIFYLDYYDNDDKNIFEKNSNLIGNVSANLNYIKFEEKLKLHPKLRSKDEKWLKRKLKKLRRRNFKEFVKGKKPSKFHPKYKAPLLTKNSTFNMNNYFEQHAWASGGQFHTLDPSSIKVKKHIIRVQNLLRAKVSPPASNMLAVSWHTPAALQAQSWAKQCLFSTRREPPNLRWTPRYGMCGQNVHITRKKKRWGQVIRTWWANRRYFKYDYFSNNKTKVAPYTQLAWYNSHKVGCGFSQCSTTRGRIFYRYVCNYCPAGNDPQRISRPYTRGRPCSYCKESCRAVCRKGRCKLCTNTCAFSNLWLNCDHLFRQWPQWLCNTKTQPGIIRFKNCRATCQCNGKIT